MKNKNLLITILVSILLVTTLFFSYKANINLTNLAADSGFDSDWGGSSSYDSSSYDYSSSDWSSSDWGSSSYDSNSYDSSSSTWDSSDRGSSSSNRSDYNYYTPGSSNLFLTSLFFTLFALLFFVPLLKEMYNYFMPGKYIAKSLIENKEAIDNIMKEIPDFNKEEFYSFVYNHFVKVQNAWSEFNYEMLRELLTDELYNTYKTQLTTLELKKQKNVMENFSLDQVVIKDFNKSAKEYTFKLQMRVRFLDYLATQKGSLLKGSKKKRIIITYNLTYLKSIVNENNTCPNCGAKLKNVASSICPYCKSVVVNNSHNYVLAKKEAITQGSE